MRIVAIAALAVSSLMPALSGARAEQPSQPGVVRNTSLIEVYEPDPRMALLPERFRSRTAHHRPRARESVPKPAK